MYREQSFNNLLLGGGGDWCPRWIYFYRLKRGCILSYCNVVLTTSPLRNEHVCCYKMVLCKISYISIHYVFNLAH